MASPNRLADSTWRDATRAYSAAPTQAFVKRLANEGYQSLVVRSFAPGAAATDLNLVLWRWGADLPARLILLDDEERLSGSLR